MPANDLPSAFLRAGMLGVRRMAETQEGLARDLWSAVAEQGDASAWNAPLAQRNDLIRNYVVDLALDWSVAARTLARGLQPVAEGPRSERTAQRVGDCVVVLPARITEASQGSATYAVDPATAQAVLDEAGLPFEPVVAGDRAALLSLFMVDYRRGDLGSYAEFGAAIMGRPRRDIMAPPGMVIFSLPVSGEFTRDCGREIWGYPKVLASDLVVRRDGPRGICRLAPSEAHGLSFSVSRRGFGRSREIPLVTYTVKDGRPTRTVFQRSGLHERLRAGGSVELVLGGSQPGRCECGLAAATPTPGCVCATLRRFGLPEKRPVASGWTEIMTGSFGIPERLQPADSAAPATSPLPPVRPANPRP